MLIQDADRQCRIRTFHDRHWAPEGRSQYGRSALLCFLRHLAACWRRAGTKVWHGRLGANVHVAMGVEHDVACLGEEEVAAVYVEDCYRVFGRYAPDMLRLCLLSASGANVR